MSNCLKCCPVTFINGFRISASSGMAWLVDVCASHADDRQAIFRERKDRTLDAIFIDHGHMFGGPNGEMRPRFRASQHLDRRLYPGVSSELVRMLTGSAVHFDIDCLWLQVQALPGEWITDSAIARLSECLNAIASSRIVERLFDALLDSYNQAEESRRDEFPFGQKLVKPVLRTGIQPAGVGDRIA